MGDDNQQAAAEGEFYNGSYVFCSRFQTSRPYANLYRDDSLHISFPILLFDASLFVICSRLIQFILKPLRQPRVVSQILGGIIMGSSTLGKRKSLQSYKFPKYVDFLCQNIAITGVVYFLFMTAVKTDLDMVMKLGKKRWYTASVGVFLPIICTFLTALSLRPMMEEQIAKVSTLWAFSSSFPLTAFTVIHPIIKELNLFSSEVGRTALTTSVLTDVIGINTILAFEAAKQEEVEHLAALSYVISLGAVMAFIFGGFKLAMLWIIKTTPEGKPVGQTYVIAILLTVLIVGFMSDMSGISIAGGSMCLGLVIPVGLPLGATLVEKSEAFIMDVMMPFFFLFVGSLVDVSSLHGQWVLLEPVFVMIILGYISKFLSTMLIFQFYDMPIKESIALSLMLSLRGEVEIILFLHWMDREIITVPYFTLFVLTTISVTAICTPLIGLFYDPARPYMVNKRRNVQHMPLNSQLRIVACIHDEKDVTGMINVLQVSNPTATGPLCVYAIQLLEMVARATPVFIEHEKEGAGFGENNYSSIHRALELFKDARSEYISFHLYTSVTFKGSMYQDICELALVKKASLVILRYDEERKVNRIGSTNRVRKSVRSLKADVLKHAPCSVALLVDRATTQKNRVRSSMRSSPDHVLVLFLGGADAREALFFANRITAYGSMSSLTLIRFLAHNDVGNDRLEKKLDDGVVLWFLAKNEMKERVSYREVIARSGEDTVSTIRALNSDEYNLLIMGRNNGINPVILEGLSEWCEDNNDELGIIGGYIATSDVCSRASLLVFQQQVLRG